MWLDGPYMVRGEHTLLQSTLSRRYCAEVGKMEENEGNSKRRGTARRRNKEGKRVRIG